MLQSVKQRILNFFWIFIFIGIALALLPLFLGFGAGGFSVQSVFTQFNFYLPLGMAFLIFLTATFIISVVVVKGDLKFGDNLGFSDGGQFPSIKFDFLKSPVKLAVLSLTLFFAMGLFTFIFAGEQSFTGVGSIQQGFGQTANLIFTSSLIPVAENLGSAFLFAVVILFLRTYANKKGMTRGTYAIMFFVLAIFSFLIYGLVNHYLRYSGSEVALSKVLFFWAFGGLITALSGSFIPFWILHVINNYFYAIKSTFSSDTAMISGIVAFVLLVLISIFFFTRGKTNKEENV